MNDIALIKAPHTPHSQACGEKQHQPQPVLLDPDTVEWQQTLNHIQQQFSQTAAHYDQTGQFPHENFRLLHHYGLLALTIPRQLGGYGATLAQARQVISAVAKGEPSTALILVMQYLQHSRLPLNQHWPEHIRLHITQDAVQNGALINALRVEPDLGTPARGGLPNTIAKRVSKNGQPGWRLNGHKIYSTGIAGLSWLAVWARTDDDEPLVGTWLIPAQAEGIEIVETWNHLGMRATGSHDVILHDVFVPDDYAVDVHLASTDRRSELDQQGVLWLSVLLSSIYDGVAQAARARFVEWLHERTPANLGAALATLPRFQEVVGKVDSLLLNNQILLDSAASGQVDAVNAGQIKYLVTSNAIAAVEAIIAAAGNPGLEKRNGLERYYRDVLCSRIHTPQNDVILLDAGRRGVSQHPTTNTAQVTLA